MNILALDTTAESCSVALWRAGEVISQLESTPRTHTRRLMPMIRTLLHEQGLTPDALTAVAFGRGPGSFTGLRIAAGVAQGLAFGLNCPVVPVSSLAACALQAGSQHGARHIAVAFDARMNEVYWGCFELVEGGLMACAEERVCPPEQVSLPSGSGAKWLGAGDGWAFADRMPTQVSQQVSHCDTTQAPTADAIVRLAAADFAKGIHYDPADAGPVYLRDSVAWQKLPGR